MKNTSSRGRVSVASLRFRVVLGFAAVTAGAACAADAPSAKLQHAVIEPFDYDGVRLLPSRWQSQFQSARDFYLGVSNDDILCGFRRAAGLPAPGKPLGGWAATNSNVVFGQWLSGMSRLYRATGDVAMRDKAATLLTEWAKTLGPDGDCRMGTYPYDKLVCGLVDLELYAGNSEARPLLDRTLNWAMQTFSRERTPATPDQINGEPEEWYTLGENLYRAYELTGNAAYRDFADSYRYPHFWMKFAGTATPPDADHVHAYSHVNTFSSVAMAYEVTGDPVYLATLRNAYDYLQNAQCFATGGFGPMERFVRTDGTLGRSVEARNASFETVCGSWAGFKMGRYLTCFTGEARYGDWIERLFYNGVGAALPICEDGKHFYYADYRVTGGMKVYKVSRFSCCSGSYIQAVTDYHNLIYYHDADSLYVSLYVPSEVTWKSPTGDVRVTQETTYPETETSTLRFDMAQPSRFALKFRVPGWAPGATARLNDTDIEVEAEPGHWAVVERTWEPGDALEIRIPLRLRMEPIDAQHPRRVAVVRGPVVLVMDDWVFEEIPSLPEPDQLESWLVPDERPGVFRIAPSEGRKYEARFRPFYAIGEVVPYRMYHDLDAEPIPVW